jgi:hypothetical protein
MTLYLWKGRRISRDDPEPEPLIIRAEKEIPDLREDGIREGRERIKKDAEVLFAALCKHLPGGTVSHLYATLAMHYANQLHVADDVLSGTSIRQAIEDDERQAGRRMAESLAWADLYQQASWRARRNLIGFLCYAIFTIACFTAMLIIAWVKGWK